MRYFFVILLLTVATVLSIAGFRGSLSRRTPLEVFPDMKRQPKLRPQKPSAFFGDQRTSRLPVAGTVPVGALLDDSPVASGRVPGTTNWVETNPLPVNAELLARGRARFTIYCSPCHSAVGDGQGITTKYGMLRAGNYHDPRIVRLADGEIFNTITLGKNLMASYASQVSVTDRWAIVAYVRALQRARLGTLEDVPSENRANLK
jgi:mono/diheme cytochrome c family protein